jgi:hypothetical protein
MRTSMLLETQEAAEVGGARPVGERREKWPDTPWPEMIKFAAIMLQLVLLAVLIKRYEIESPAFFDLTVLAFAGFAVHYLLPLTYRFSFFLVLSVAAIVMVLGVTQAAWLLGIGFVIIGLCHAPLRFSVRVTLLAALGAVLAAMRGGIIYSVVPMAIWPILGSMFLFRLVIYLYDIHYQTAPVSVSRSLSYFFMLPNVCFPLFPVVDYQSFCRNYYDADRYHIYQVGVRWIFRGVVHLILYRILYKNWSMSLYEVENAGDLVHYSVWLFLLYLRVSGQFHIIVGMLHLFGFNLAETHHLYYLSSSFTDFWRRINIYWKDFMMKIFFYPVYFRIKSWGPVAALVVSTLVVFVLTWLLHAVQWFWLRGSFLWAANDLLFWSILAALVVINSLWEMKRGRNRKSALGQMSWPAALVVGLKTLATFTVICGLWSLWTSESASAWFSLWQFALVPPTAGGWALIAFTVATLVGSAALIARNPAGFASGKMSFMNESALNCAGIILVLALSVSFVNRHLGAAGQLIASSRQPMLNRLEMEELERGYYENLLEVNRFNGELWSLYSKRPKEALETVLQAGLATPTNNLLRYELRPSVTGQYRGIAWQTNRWGMRDKDYTLERPAGCYRIAILGASHAMGLGVEATHTFETLVEDRLNREHGRPGRSFELLNFSVTGYKPIRQVWMLQDKVLRFEPNLVIFAGHYGDADRCVYELMQAVHDRVELPGPYLRSLVARAQIDAETPAPLMRRKLQPHTNEILSWMFDRFVALTKENGASACYILLPLAPGQKNNPAEAGPDLELAKKAGFKVIDLSDAYEGHTWQSLWVSEVDTHPNVLGHQLLAARLYERLVELQLVPVN